MRIFGILWTLVLVLFAVIIGHASGRHANNRVRRDADGHELGEVAAKLPGNLGANVNKR